MAQSRLCPEFDPEFVKQFTAELNAVKPVNSKLQACLKLLHTFKISYVLKKANPNLFLVHKANRGGLGLSPYNVHKNAATIKSVGANKNKLDASVAIELAPSGP